MGNGARPRSASAGGATPRPSTDPAGPLTLGFFLIGLGAGDDVAIPFLAEDLGAGERGLGVLVAAVGAGLLLGYVTLAGCGHRLAAMTGLVVGALAAGLGLVVAGPLVDATSARTVLVASGGDSACSAPW